jgi:hypothetical protein
MASDDTLPWMAAHLRSAAHRAEITASTHCGCFYCKSTFAPSEIVDWTDTDESGVGQTALCPRCGIDSVIGDNSGFPITADLLATMHQAWFQPNGRSRR